jgi:hypothetical protein
MDEVIKVTPVESMRPMSVASLNKLLYSIPRVVEETIYSGSNLIDKKPIRLVIIGEIPAWPIKKMWAIGW